MKSGFSKTLLLLIASLTISLTGLTFSVEASSATIIDSLPYIINEPGTYVLSEDLSVSGNAIIVNTSNVVIDGNGHTIQGDGTGYGITIDGSNYNVIGNVTIKNIKITSFGRGIHVYDIYTDKDMFSGIIIENVEIESVVIAISISDIEYGFIIRNAVLKNLDDAGIYMKYAYGGIIENIVSTGGMYGIYIEDSEGTYIRESRITGASLVGVYIADAESIAIVDSTIKDIDGNGVNITRYSDALILGSRIENCSGSGISLTSTPGNPGGVGNAYIVYSVISNTNNYGIESSGHLLLVRGSIIKDIIGTGIYISAGIGYIINNHIIGNTMYAIKVETSDTIIVTNNTIANNGYSPQAYDLHGTGSWESNYWSDLSDTVYIIEGGGASDNSPLDEPYYDLVVEDITAPRQANAGSVVDVTVTVSNRGYGDASDAPVTLYWGEPVEFKQINYTWIDVDPASAQEVYSDDVVEDYGNYTLMDEDDGYFVYKLPWPINLYGYYYEYISVSTNGYIELLSSDTSILEGDYSIHSYGYHRTYQHGYTLGVSTIFAYSGDLSTYDGYVGVYNINNETIVVEFHGSTYEDEDPVNAPVRYQIILEKDGDVIISLGEISYSDLYGDGFTGVYVQPIGLEITAGYILEPYTSWRINTAIHKADEKNVDVPSFSTKDVVLEWDTSRLPHYSPFTLWASAGGTGDSALYNPPIIWQINLSPQQQIVGGEISNASATNKSVAVITLILVVILTISVLIVRRIQLLAQ